MDYHRLQYIEGEGPDPGRLELASLIRAATDADDAELAEWPVHLLHRTDARLAELEATAVAVDAEPRHQVDEELWTMNHRMMTKARYLRAKIRPHLTAARSGRR